MRHTFPCPRCNRILKRSGDLIIEGQAVTLDTFQCDECMGEFKIGNSTFPTAFTFVVDADGRVLNHTTLKPL